MSHFAPPPAEGMGSNWFNTISWYHVYWNHLFLSIYHQLILAQLEEWEGDLQNALHSQMSERIESSSRNVFFFQIFFRFSDSLFSPIFLFFRKSSDDERSSGGEGRRLSKILSFFSRWEFSKQFLGEFTFWFWLILNSYKNVYALLLFVTYSHNLLNIKVKSRAN